MAELFRVHLASLDTNAKGDKFPAMLLLQHSEVCGQGRGAMFEDMERHEIGARELTQLLPRLYYAAANVVSEVEDGQALSVRHTAEVPHNKSPAFIHLQDGGRLFLLHPVENGEYLLAVTIPVCVWQWMGPTAVHVVLSTAVQGYEVPTNVAAVASVPMYCPLRDRIDENLAAVEEAIRVRVKQLIQFVGFLNECGHREALSSSALLRGGQETAATVRRLSYERPSPIRTHVRLTVMLQQLLWSATSPSDYIALNGAMASGGMCNGYKRLVVTAAAVWYHGIPLFSNALADDFEAHLLPAAIVAYAQRCLAGRIPNASQYPITVKCLAMHSCGGLSNVCASGYMKRQQQQDSTAAACVAFVSSGGWIIVLRLEAALNAFTGTPMSHIVSGVSNLITITLETPRMGSMLQQFTADSALGAQLASNITTVMKNNLPATVPCIMKALRHFGVFERCCSSTAYASAISRDTCIYRYSTQAASDEVSGSNRWCPWPEHTRRAVLRVVELATLSFRRRRRRCCRRACSGVGGDLVFSLLRGRDAVVVLLAVPVYDPVPKIVSLLAEMDPVSLSAVPAVELRAFAMRMLLKAL